MGSYIDFLSENSSTLLFESYQHMSYVVQSLAIGLVLGLAVAVLCYRSVNWTGMANAGSAMAMTLPGFAVFGLAVAIMSPGVIAAVVVLVFYGMMPILRNAVVGLRGVDSALIESAKGMGMSRTTILMRLEIPMAWPVIMTGVRVSAQMMMGVAAIAAYMSGPGLGTEIFQGLSQLGNVDATERVVVATVLIIILAIILDLILGFIARLTTSRGIRV